MAGGSFLHSSLLQTNLTYDQGIHSAQQDLKPNLYMEHSPGLGLLRFTVMMITDSSMHGDLLVRINESPNEGQQEDEVSFRQLENEHKFRPW